MREKLNMAVHVIQQYLCELAFSGHHIIHSVPVFLPGSCSAFGFTSVAHHIIAQREITIQTCRHARKESPVILILGMCNFRRLDFRPLQWCIGWGMDRIRSLGTIYLSRHAFLEGKLLRRLERINAKTTIVPKLTRKMEHWDFQLIVWENDDLLRERDCTWTPVEDSQGCLEFVWEHRDNWTHEHSGTAGDETNGEIKIQCESPNIFEKTLCLPQPLQRQNAQQDPHPDSVTFWIIGNHSFR
jgi:hypothetical protein